MMKGQKGITLVALIITIIVMLILVGVSISVALNGGLFTKAGDASRETKQAQVSYLHWRQAAEPFPHCLLHTFFRQPP